MSASLSEQQAGVLGCDDAAVALLAIREHSRAELVRKLVARGYSQEEIGTALDQLEALGHLDDQRFTEQYLQMRIRKGYGPRKIRQELKERGIAADVIQDWVDDSDPMWKKELQRVAERKFGVLLERSSKELARRARFLEYRGFPSYLIRDLLFD